MAVRRRKAKPRPTKDEPIKPSEAGSGVVTVAFNEVTYGSAARGSDERTYSMPPMLKDGLVVKAMLTPLEVEVIEPVIAVDEPALDPTDGRVWLTTTVKTSEKVPVPPETVNAPS